jgi:hypothetical protein
MIGSREVEMSVASLSMTWMIRRTVSRLGTLYVVAA